MIAHSGQEAVIPVVNLSDLIAQLEASDAGSYVLNEVISAALCKRRFRTCIAGLPDEQGGLWMYEFDGHAPSSALRVTQSIDAVIAMAEMVLPGRFWMIKGPHRGIYRAAFYGQQSPTRGSASSPSIAACIAVLKAVRDAEVIHRRDEGDEDAGVTS